MFTALPTANWSQINHSSAPKSTEKKKSEVNATEELLVHCCPLWAVCVNMVNLMWSHSITHLCVSAVSERAHAHPPTPPLTRWTQINIDFHLKLKEFLYLRNKHEHPCSSLPPWNTLMEREREDRLMQSWDVSLTLELLILLFLFGVCVSVFFSFFFLNRVLQICLLSFNIWRTVLFSAQKAFIVHAIFRGNFWVEETRNKKTQILPQCDWLIVSRLWNVRATKNV